MSPKNICIACSLLHVCTETDRSLLLPLALLAVLFIEVSHQQFKTPSLVLTVARAFDGFVDTLTKPVDEATCKWLGWFSWPLDLLIEESTCKMKPKQELYYFFTCWQRGCFFSA
jgi:hypothetical protein